ncbi:hypothetical protein [Geoalkalibacter halelectricus]|uniref:Uncharacterized protein n=1 Tax=Geoalkalibacter halelectricus TaxID=2847045 RepID=A0ABY5ZM47_9BACT|nr:hypothetical protein [Geoalkalibacter halelectricus]MDO3378475.1 hypothetical protein [Geoalkalibacter halelectricus]UWZ80205.1 hypothetical protein L9S41_02120 [Geoalkalibacter halelectricus]
MNGLRTLTASLAVLLLSAVPAFAAGSRVDHSGLVVWAFLGFCGLIVVAQLVPALLLMLGLAKATIAYRPPTPSTEK